MYLFTQVLKANTSLSLKVKFNIVGCKFLLVQQYCLNPISAGSYLSHCVLCTSLVPHFTLYPLSKMDYINILTQYPVMTM